MKTKLPVVSFFFFSLKVNVIRLNFAAINKKIQFNKQPQKKSEASAHQDQFRVNSFKLTLE